MSILAFVSDQHPISRILEHLGLRPPELRFSFPSVCFVSHMTALAATAAPQGSLPTQTPLRR